MSGTSRISYAPWALVVTVVITQSGCSTLAVSHGEGSSATKVGGVPFYVKKNIYRHVTTYAKTEWDVTVSLETLAEAVAKEGGVRRLAQVTVPDSEFRAKVMNELRTAVTVANATSSLTLPQFDAALARVTMAITCTNYDLI